MNSSVFHHYFRKVDALVAFKDRRGGTGTGKLMGYDDLGVCLDMGDDCETFFPWTSIHMIWNGEAARRTHEAAEEAKAKIAELKAAMAEIEDDDGPRPALSAEEAEELLHRLAGE